jgi:hypothetical protein
MVLHYLLNKTFTSSRVHIPRSSKARYEPFTEALEMVDVIDPITYFEGKRGGVRRTMEGRQRLRWCTYKHTE